MKLLAFDLDDTILNSKKCISDRTRKAIMHSKEQGEKIGFITARSPRKVGHYLQGIPYDFISYYNGASTYADNALISDISMPCEEAYIAIRLILQAIPDLHMSINFEPYSYRDKIIKNVFTNEIVGWDMFTAPNYNVQRMHIYLENYESHDFRQYIFSSMDYIETKHNTAIITSVGANKGSAIKAVTQYYKINQSDVLSFGDDTSDIPMFKESGISIAVDNALDELKLIANHVTASCDNDGVASYLEEYVLQ